MPQSEEEETKQEGEEEERKKDERRGGAESLEEGRAKRKMEEEETKQEEKRRKVVDLDKRIKDLLGEDYGVPEHLLSERGSASSFPSSSSSSSFPSSPHSFICMPPKAKWSMPLPTRYPTRYTSPAPLSVATPPSGPPPPNRSLRDRLGR